MHHLLLRCFQCANAQDGDAARPASLEVLPAATLAKQQGLTATPLPVLQGGSPESGHEPRLDAVLAATATKEHAQASVLLLLDATGQQLVWSNCSCKALQELQACGAGQVHILQQLLGCEEGVQDVTGQAWRDGLWKGVISSVLADQLLHAQLQQQTGQANSNAGPISVPAGGHQQVLSLFKQQAAGPLSLTDENAVASTQDVVHMGDMDGLAPSSDAGHGVNCPPAAWQGSHSPLSQSKQSPVLPSSRVPSGSVLLPPATLSVDTSSASSTPQTPATTEWPACASRLASGSGVQPLCTPPQSRQGRMLVHDVPIATWRFSTDNNRQSSRQVAPAQQDTSAEAQQSMNMLQRACFSHSGAPGAARCAGVLHQTVSCKQASIEPISGAPSQNVVTQRSSPVHPCHTPAPETPSYQHGGGATEFMLCRESSRELYPGSLLQPTHSTLQPASSHRRSITIPHMARTAARPAEHLLQHDSQEVSSPYHVVRKDDVSSPMAASQASATSSRRKPPTSHASTVGAQMGPKTSALFNSMGLDQLLGQAPTGISNSDHTMWQRNVSHSGHVVQPIEAPALSRLVGGSQSYAGNSRQHSGMQAAVTTIASTVKTTLAHGSDWEEELGDADGLRVNSADDIIQTLLVDCGVPQYGAAPRIPNTNRMLVKNTSSSTLNSASSVNSAHTVALAAASASAEHRHSPLHRSAGPSPAARALGGKPRPYKAPSTPMILGTHGCSTAAAGHTAQGSMVATYRRSKSVCGKQLSLAGRDNQEQHSPEVEAQQRSCLSLGMPEGSLLACTDLYLTPLLSQPLPQEPQQQVECSAREGEGERQGVAQEELEEDKTGLGMGQDEELLSRLMALEGPGQLCMQQDCVWGRDVEVDVRPVQQRNLPPGSPPLLLVSCMDITARVMKEGLLMQVMENQLGMVSQMFPMHVLHYLSLQKDQQNNPGTVACSHSDITILFMDVVGFTSMSKEVPPEQVMAYLNELFSVLDDLVTYYNLHKVETAGDCYIVCSGVLTEVEGGFLQVVGQHDKYHSAKLIMDCAKDMLASTSQVLMPGKMQQPTKVRIGIHTGNATSGVVGSKLPKWSIYGDSINTASRMESTSLPGRIQVSAVTKELLPHEAWEETGGVEVKGKGLMETFLWVPSSEPQNDYQGNGMSIPDSGIMHCSQHACHDVLVGLRMRNALAPIQELEPGMSQLDASTCPSAAGSAMPSAAGHTSEEWVPTADLRPSLIADITASDWFAPSRPSPAVLRAASLRRRLSRSSSSHAQHHQFDRQLTAASGTAAHSGPLPRIQVALDSPANMDPESPCLLIGHGSESYRSQQQQDIAVIWHNISTAASRRTSMDTRRNSCDRPLRGRPSYDRSVSPAAACSNAGDEATSDPASNSNAASMQQTSAALSHAAGAEQRTSLEFPAALLNSLNSYASVTRSSQSSQDAQPSTSHSSPHATTQAMERRTPSAQQQGHDSSTCRTTGSAQTRHGKSPPPCTSGSSNSSLSQRVRCLMSSVSSRQLALQQAAAVAGTGAAAFGPVTPASAATASGAASTAHATPVASLNPRSGAAGVRARRGSSTDVLLSSGYMHGGEENTQKMLDMLMRLGVPAAGLAVSRPRPARQLRWGTVEHAAADGGATDNLAPAAARERGSRRNSEAAVLAAQGIYLRKDSTGELRDEARSGGSGLLATGSSWKTGQSLMDSDPDGSSILPLLPEAGSMTGRTSSVTPHRAVRTILDQHGGSNASGSGSSSAMHARAVASHLSSSPRTGGGEFSLTALMHVAAWTAFATTPSALGPAGTTDDIPAGHTSAGLSTQADMPYSIASQRRRSMVMLPKK